MTPSEHDLYVLLWRKVYRWLLARGPRQDLLWSQGDADPQDESTWTSPEHKGGKPLVLLSINYKLGTPRGPGYVYIEWFLVLAIAETEGVLQPDETAFLRDHFTAIMRTGAVADLLGAAGCTVPIMRGVSCNVPTMTDLGDGGPCALPSGHTGPHAPLALELALEPKKEPTC